MRQRSGNSNHVLRRLPGAWFGAWCVVAAITLCVTPPMASARQTTPEGEKLAPGDAMTELPVQVRNLGIEEHLGQPVPMELEFTNSAGEQVHLGQYFKNTNKPAIIGLVYYTCPVTCTAVMDKLATCINRLDLDVGKDFQVLMFSFKESETTDLAAGLKQHFLSEYNRSVTKDGIVRPESRVTDETRKAWEFHTGPSHSSRSLADALGFRYRQLENGEFSHPVCLFIVTPEGKIARYIYGFEYDPKDVKLSLMEAASGRLTKGLTDKVLAFCYMWDGKTSKYSLQVTRVMQLGGLVTVVLLGGLIGGLFFAERVRRSRANAAAGGVGAGSVVVPVVSPAVGSTAIKTA
jgi:protein SCO1/2